VPPACEGTAGRPRPRVSCFGYPVRGHTVPSLPVIAELTRRGVEVDCHSSPAFAPAIAGAGARFVAYPAESEALLTTPVDSAEHLARSLAATEALLPALLQPGRPPPALVLFDASALWGGILARCWQRPAVASITTFAMNRTLLQLTHAPEPAAWSVPIRERLNVRYGAGFHDHRDLMTPKADLKLVYTSRAFQPAGRFFDRSHLFLGPLLNQRVREGATIRATGSRPLAYVSLGTLFNQDQALLRRIGTLLAARGWQVVVSLGDAQARHDGDWPEHVQAHAFVDQVGVLAQADLFVTHGGMNSVSEALAQAVPMVVIPQAVDQHLVARQTANLGAAVVIDRDAVSTESLAAALDRFDAGRTGFQAAASRLQASFTDVLTVADAVDQMLALLQDTSAHA